LGVAASGLSAEAYGAMLRMRLALAPKLEAYMRRISPSPFGASMPKGSGCEERRTPPWSPAERVVRASLFTERAIAIPADVLADRDRRLSVEQTVHMRLLGDPVGRARECAEEDPRCAMTTICSGQPRSGRELSPDHCAARPHLSHVTPEQLLEPAMRSPKVVAPRARWRSNSRATSFEVVGRAHARLTRPAAAASSSPRRHRAQRTPRRRRHAAG
jgi:hypothetical protein